MKRFWIWYHRRRAQFHRAIALHPQSVFNRCPAWHDSWAQWHNGMVLYHLQATARRVDPYDHNGVKL